ncbi:hypothetical protein ZIOFF_063526 [Zingiber officinale]|uniref:Uncharacterized protein n=1 Tax=Zingiber officinale TaxID=94328 RepID=A0A8J5FBC2_ZINOF|nr:hypothetical protein ZIOFF_063526 [Zingiber officinale]
MFTVHYSPRREFLSAALLIASDVNSALSCPTEQHRTEPDFAGMSQCGLELLNRHIVKPPAGEWWRAKPGDQERILHFSMHLGHSPRMCHKVGEGRYSARELESILYEECGRVEDNFRISKAYELLSEVGYLSLMIKVGVGPSSCNTRYREELGCYRRWRKTVEFLGSDVGLGEDSRTYSTVVEGWEKTLQGFLTLLLRPGPSLRLLGSARGARDQRALARVEAALLLGMFLMQSLALVTACTLRQRWVRQFEEMEADREAAAGRRSRRMARVQEEAIANAAAAARELEEKLRNKKGQWVKNDLEGRKISPVDF